MRIRALVLVAALTVAAGAAHAQSKPRGVTEGRSSAGLVYSLRQPAGYEKSEARELWLLLHGSGDTHDNFMKFWAPLDCLEDAALLSPQATNRRWDGEDLERLRVTLDELIEQLEPRHVYIAGFSAGAGMCYQLGLTERARLSGLLPYAAGMSSPPPPGDHDLPICHIHGELDSKVPFASGEESVAALRSAGYSMVRLCKLLATNHILRDWAVTGGVAWLRARVDLPSTDDVEACLEAARAAHEAGDDGRARVLAGRAGAAGEELLEELDAEALKRARALARKIPKAKDRGWQARDELLRALHPTVEVLEVLDAAVEKLAEKHEKRAASVVEKGTSYHDKGDYPRAIGCWAEIQQKYYMAPACKLADQRINEYLTDPAIRAKLNVR